MANSLIKFDAGCHWYDRDGKPQHEADLRVARKVKLYPSVTSIDKDEFKNDFLERWKMNQLVISACENPRYLGESDQQFAQRIYDISNTKARNAAAFGKRIHRALEEYPVQPAFDLLTHFINFQKWYESSIESCVHSEEILLDHELGVAGTTDFIGYGKGDISGRVVADWKTQDVKTDDKGRKKPVFYDSWGRQLSFYGATDAKIAGAFPVLPTCVSVIIDSNPDAGIYVKVWTKEEMVSSYEDFVIASYRWFKRKSYWPQTSGPFSVKISLPMPSSIAL